MVIFTLCWLAIGLVVAIATLIRAKTKKIKFMVEDLFLLILIGPIGALLVLSELLYGMKKFLRKEL